MKYTATFLFAALSFASLASAELHQLDFTLDRDDSTELSATLAPGDLLRINLKENPSTGYAWRFQNPFERPSGVYSIEMDNYVEDANPASQAGVAGLRTLLLKGEKAGTDDFELVYVRLWEVQDFVEATDSNGKAIEMKDVPNAGYKKITVTVADE
ncbi:hypothetical protein FGO68_gene14007 [Halteria grandinella]|uniref:Proteinase inhibitor I42 chagasin domain-containing protein n=1 Tax=Halteria grandinella TaxID=5974 RepID=A0A8J8NJ94_HALGN|nr:hypothetical protein FGO68_gene14007 [Halteria grandinella]